MRRLKMTVPVSRRCFCLISSLFLLPLIPISARFVRLWRARACDHQCAKRSGACRGALRRAEYAAGDCGRGGVAHSRSLWTNRGVFEDERDRTAFDAKIWAGDTVAGCGKLLDSRVCFSSLITVQQRLRIFIGVEACVDVVTFVGCN